MEDINQLLTQIQKFRNKTLNYYSFHCHSLAIIRNMSPSKVKLIIQEIILRFWLFFQHLSIRRKLPKYVFSSLRFPALIFSLPPKEVMVMGGIKELIFCLKNGFRFYWTGPIYYGFNLFIFSGKSQLFSRVIAFLRNMFSEVDNEKRYLFLCDDSLPEGMTLSFSLESVSQLNIICIEHGIISSPKKKYNVKYVNGESCQFNLLWDKSQKELFKDDEKHASYVLGLPYEVHPVQNICKEVILVGHCGLNSDSLQYFHSLYYFCKIYRMLEAAGIKVFYRPHPQDDIEQVNLIFSNISITEKSELLSSSGRVFIGFVSSFIFEAQEFGHKTIGLDFETLEFGHRRAFDVDYEVSANNFENLPDLILEIFEKPVSVYFEKSKKLKDRFNRCLQQIDEFNSTHKPKDVLV